MPSGIGTIDSCDLGEGGIGCCLGRDESLDGKWGFLRIVSDALGVLSCPYQSWLPRHQDLD